MRRYIQCNVLAILLMATGYAQPRNPSPNPSLTYKPYKPAASDRVLDRKAYYNSLYGFWLGTCIANWTGLVTEMDKIGDIGEIKTGAFYTRADWRKPDQPSIWGKGIPSNISPTIDFVFAQKDSTWGADDDTDIEYIYQELLLQHGTSMLSGEQIRAGWMAHIKKEEENFLWVSNQKAFDLMQQGLVPPATGDPRNNPEYEMIDAQLTTEIFGLYAPTRPDIAKRMASLPIQNTARENSEWIARFYVEMFSLASATDPRESMKTRTQWMASEARKNLPAGSYAAAMYDFVLGLYRQGIDWEKARDAVYKRYQLEEQDGYTLTSRKLYCNGCFAAGINFASSLISLFWGEGDYTQTIQIGTLAGWDSDNPTATWGGLLGFMLGKAGIEKTFSREFSHRFYIHRTRTGFPNNGMDDFEQMALKGIWIVDRVIQEQMGGGVDVQKGIYYIPIPATSQDRQALNGTTNPPE